MSCVAIVMIEVLDSLTVLEMVFVSCFSWAEHLDRNVTIQTTSLIDGFGGILKFVCRTVSD